MVLSIPNVHPARKLSHDVILSGQAEPGSESKIPVWAKSCFDLCVCCTASFLVEKESKFYLLLQSVKIIHKSRISETLSLMKFSV